jgi:hypothetical protein
MNKQSTCRLSYIAASGLCGLGLSGYALASPPLSPGAPSFAAAEPAPSTAVARRLLALQAHIPAAPLDLRARVDSSQAAIEGYAVEFPSSPAGKPALHDDDRIWPSALVNGEASFHSMSPAQVFARRVHQEGVPVARLWESRSALLSIGLNQQGKPGVWLIQKIH